MTHGDDQTKGDPGLLRIIARAIPRPAGTCAAETAIDIARYCQPGACSPGYISCLLRLASSSARTLHYGDRNGRNPPAAHGQKANRPPLDCRWTRPNRRKLLDPNKSISRLPTTPSIRDKYLSYRGLNSYFFLPCGARVEMSPPNTSPGDFLVGPRYPAVALIR